MQVTVFKLLGSVTAVIGDDRADDDERRYLRIDSELHSIDGLELAWLGRCV